jgi:hypothetical protein
MQAPEYVLAAKPAALVHVRLGAHDAELLCPSITCPWALTVRLDSERLRCEILDSWETSPAMLYDSWLVT